MASELKQWCMVCAVVVVLSWGCWVEADPQVPCYFIFGDSLVDNGNNNGIASLARANYLPYGIDFPQGPTGRFSNGKTTVDVIGELSISIFLTSYFCMQLVHMCVYVCSSHIFSVSPLACYRTHCFHGYEYFVRAWGVKLP